MLAASYWSLLAPAVEMAMSSGGFGAFAFFPVAVGFTLGAAFVYLADLVIPHLVSTADQMSCTRLSDQWYRNGYFSRLGLYEEELHLTFFPKRKQALGNMTNHPLSYILLSSDFKCQTSL